MRRGVALILICVCATAFGQSPHTLSKLYKTIKNSYVDTVDCRAAINRAAVAMACDLDIYTRYLNKKQYAQLKQLKQGSANGVGIELETVGQDTVASKVHTLSPAYKAGVRAGQRLTEVENGADSARFKANEVLYRLHCKKFAINIVDCTKMLIRNVGYIKFDNFRKTASDTLYAAFQKMKSDGAQAVIIDLRDNGGGVLSECVKVASLLLPQNRLVTRTKGRLNDCNKDYYTVNFGNDTTTKIVILTSNRTGSAAEMLVGAMQDYKRAVVVGAQTYGKGTGQQLFKVDKDCYVLITVLKYFTPGGRTFVHSTGGLKPDIEVAGALYVDIENLGRDKAVQKAIEII